jgi:hypothetical protein
VSAAIVIPAKIQALQHLRQRQARRFLPVAGRRGGGGPGIPEGFGPEFLGAVDPEVMRFLQVDGGTHDAVFPRRPTLRRRTDATGRRNRD